MCRITFRITLIRIDARWFVESRESIFLSMLSRAIWSLMGVATISASNAGIKKIA
jgi:hypothetical protein